MPEPIASRCVNRGPVPALLRLILLPMLVVAGVLGVGSHTHAGAEPAEGQAIFGTLDYDDAEGEEIPVVGATVSVEGVGETVTGVDGSFRIVVPEPGDYEVSVDAAELPDGVSFRAEDGGTLTARVPPSGDRIVLFSLVEGDGAQSSGSSISGRRVAQLATEGLKIGLYLAMAAIGLSLIFGTTGLVNFAHAELVTWGMLSAFFFNYYGLAGVFGFLESLPAPLGGGVNLIFAGVLAAIAGGALGWVLNRFIFRPARKAGVSLIAQMVMTIGLSILIRYLLLYNFGGGSRPYRDYSAQRAIEIGPVEITEKDLVAMAVSIILLIGVATYLQRTQMGKAMRAVSDNRELAESTGIDVERVISNVWVAGAALAALGGVFFGLDQTKWDFGFRTLLLIFAAVTLGGLGTTYGALVGSLVVGLAINLSTLIIDAELKNMVALVVMGFILLVRPQGILGRAERIG